jgi:SPP1 family phage portal protein
MQLLKTDKTVLTTDEILQYIADYEIKQVKDFDKLWRYYKGDDATIMDRKAVDPNSPNNKVPIPYGRKIITTFVGYAYRPRYITYKAVENKAEKTQEEQANESENIEPTNKQESQEALFYNELQSTYNMNNEHIKTSRAGRNTGIYGVAYELLYMDGTVNQDQATNSELPIKTEPRFFPVDPREMILLYDYSSEPKKIMATRFYRIDDDWYKVEMYYKDKIIIYDRKREKGAGTHGKWVLINPKESINFFSDIPVVAYYFGDEMIGIIAPVLPLIDAYDKLVSDSMNEYEKFAAAYLVLKGMKLIDPSIKPDQIEGAVSRILQSLKRKRIIEMPAKDSEVNFLTKDIPTAFITFMTELVKKEIHNQSHVPDFKDMATGSLSGAAISRMLFDFENVVSSAEADFDVGLSERIKLIAIAYEKLRRATGTPDMISISHKRNLPADLKEKAETANQMKAAGFSRYLIADIMPDDIVPDVEEELKRQDEDNAALMPDISSIPEPDVQTDADGNPIDAQGYLIDNNGERMLDENGKPMKGKVTGIMPNNLPGGKK